ncbi:unnamed protein product [Oikopleura dioica]|uniref:Uncharacterized protein n=2 Tax=Oikopleura dioica TaxID=34765 RepID=E4XLC1_OIKDI|nr:unnamed protein product [Oikopleura dioica]
MSNNRESEIIQPEDIIDLSPYDDLDCDMDVDRDEMFEVYEQEEENKCQEPDKKNANKIPENEEETVDGRENEIDSEECEFLECISENKDKFNDLLDSDKQQKLDCEAFEIDNADPEIQKLLEAPIKVNKQQMEIQESNDQIQNNLANWASNPLIKGRRSNEKRFFSEPQKPMVAARKTSSSQETSFKRHCHCQKMDTLNKFQNLQSNFDRLQIPELDKNISSAIRSIEKPGNAHCTSCEATFYGSFTLNLQGVENRKI